MVVCTLVMASSPPEGLTPGNCACCLPSLARGSNSAYTPGALNRQAVDSSCTLKIAQPTLSLTVSAHDVFLLLALLSSLPLQRAVFPSFPVMALFPLSDSPPGGGAGGQLGKCGVIFGFWNWFSRLFGKKRAGLVDN